MQKHSEPGKSDHEKMDDGYLTGKLLLAMPGMQDKRFHKAVIYVCAHDKNGAMGLVVNHTMPDVKFKSLLKQLDIVSERQPAVKDIPIMSGGPVETARGFLLHSNDFKQKDTVIVNDEISVTGTIEALQDVVNGQGPRKMLFILGYAGWQAGQLDREIHENAWLSLDADQDLIFNTDFASKWDRAIGKLGIDPAMLSSTAGRA